MGVPEAKKPLQGSMYEGVMTPNNTMRRVLATRNLVHHIRTRIDARFWGVGQARRNQGPPRSRLALALLASTLLGPFALHAQEAAMNQSPAIAPAQPPALLPNGVPAPAATIQAFNAVSDWVRALEVPSDAQSATTLACIGVSITLRLDGKIIGRGSMFTLDAPQQKETLIRAARSAIAEARSRMPGDRDALFAERAKELAKTITISLELAGTPVPIDLDDWSQAAQRINPGVDGVAVRLGDRIEAMFPASMLYTQTEPATAMQGLISRVGNDTAMGLLPLADLKKKHGVVFYRVPVTHVVQTKPGGSAQFLHRGGVVFDSARLDRAELLRWGDSLRRRLSSCFTSEGAATSEGQTLEQTTLARAALMRWSHVAHDDSAAKIAQAIDANIHVRTSFDAAMVSSAWTPSSLDDAPMRHRIRRSVNSSALVTTEGEFLNEVPLPVRSRIVLALAFDDEFARATSGARTLYASNTPLSLAAQMPWLGWASLRMSGPTGDIPPAVALREMRSAIWKAQLRPESIADGERDLAGGIRIAVEMPTWHVAQPLAFIATMLREKRLTEPSETARETARLLASLRFLRQLTADENSAWMFEHRETAIGGVRASPWDQRMPIEATAMTLIAVSETIRSIDELAKRPPAAPEKP